MSKATPTPIPQRAVEYARSLSDAGLSWADIQTRLLSELGVTATMKAIRIAVSELPVITDPLERLAADQRVLISVMQAQAFREPDALTRSVLLQGLNKPLSALATIEAPILRAKSRASVAKSSGNGPDPFTLLQSALDDEQSELERLADQLPAQVTPNADEPHTDNGSEPPVDVAPEAGPIC